MGSRGLSRDDSQRRVLFINSELTRRDDGGPRKAKPLRTQSADQDYLTMRGDNRVKAPPLRGLSRDDSQRRVLFINSEHTRRDDGGPRKAKPLRTRSADQDYLTMRGDNRVKAPPSRGLSRDAFHDNPLRSSSDHHYNVARQNSFTRRGIPYRPNRPNRYPKLTKEQIQKEQESLNYIGWVDRDKFKETCNKFQIMWDSKPEGKSASEGRRGGKRNLKKKRAKERKRRD